MSYDATRRDRIDERLLRRVHETGDAAARDACAERFMPLVRSIARKYVSERVGMDELVQVGSIGLVKAMNRFDPDAGHRFASFAGPNIAGEIRRHFRDHTWDVHVPRSLQELDARVHGATRAIRADTGREPSDDDLAAALEITPEEVREGRAAGRAYRALSLDVPAGEGQDSADSHGVAEPGYPRVEDTATIEEAMGALDARERSLVDMRFHEDLLQREIADRVGLSQMQVSRLLTGALEKMTAHVAAGRGAPAALAH